MDYRRFQQRCTDCSKTWNAAFGIVGTTIIAEPPHVCPHCKSPKIVFHANSWKMEKPMLFVDIAKVCHEANRAYCESLGDFSQQSWAFAPGWQRGSAISGVKFHLAHPDALDSASHENWMRDKFEDGWMYGPVKNAEAKTHPCLVPFEQLPPEQQAKDRLFRAIVHALRDQ